MQTNCCSPVEAEMHGCFPQSQTFHILNAVGSLCQVARYPPIRVSVESGGANLTMNAKRDKLWIVSSRCGPSCTVCAWRTQGKGGKSLTTRIAMAAGRRSCLFVDGQEHRVERK